MITALNDGSCGNYCELCILLKVGDVCNTAVAHCGLNLVEALCHVVLEGTCVGYVRVNALFEGKLCLTAKVVSLPVTCTV